MEKDLPKILQSEKMDDVLEYGTRNIGFNFTEESRYKPVQDIVETLKGHYQNAHLTMHTPVPGFGCDHSRDHLVMVRLWSERPEIQEKYGHPDWSLNRNIALIESEVGQEAAGRLRKSYELVDTIETPNGFHNKKTEIYKI